MEVKNLLVLNCNVIKKYMRTIIAKDPSDLPFRWDTEQFSHWMTSFLILV